MPNDDRGDTYRDGFVALRNLTVHTQGCARCLRMSSKGQPCPVWAEAIEHISKANGLWQEEQRVSV